MYQNTKATITPIMEKIVGKDAMKLKDSVIGVDMEDTAVERILK